MNGFNLNSMGDALRVCRQSLISVAMFSGVSNLLMLTPAFFMLNIYDKALGSNSIDTLIVLSVLAAFMFFVMATLDTIRGRVLAHVSTRIDRLLATDIYKRMFKVTLKLGAQSTSQPLRDLEAIRRFITGSGLVAILDAPWIPIYITVLFLFHPLLGWIGIVAAGFFLALAVMNERATAPALLAANEQQRQLNLNLQRSLRDYEVVAAMGMLGALEQNWRAAQEQVIRKQEVAVSRSSTFIAVVKTMRMAVQSSALAAGAYLALAQEISPGTVIAGSILVGRALQPVEVAIGSWRSFVECWQQVGRLNNLLTDIELASPQMSLPPISGHITATNADIVAPESQSKPVVRQVTFDVPPGAVVMIIGPSGAGKSSLIRAVLGLWRTSSGELRLDGAEANKFDRSDLGPQLGYLPQDIELLEGSVSENIARFSEVDPASVVRAARDAGVHELILSLPDGYDTVLNQAGNILSPGQQQRIALARALYCRPKLVVLDEPNSNLDSEGDAALHAAIEMLKASGSTVLVVSHREGIFPLADFLMVMRDGTLSDFGPRDEVMSRNKTRKQQPTGINEPKKLGSPTVKPRLAAAKFSMGESPKPDNIVGSEDE